MSGLEKIKAPIFEQQNLELDSAWICPNLYYIATEAEVGTYRGRAVWEAGNVQMFALRVEQDSQQMSVTIDLSVIGTQEPTYTVAKGGYILFSVSGSESRGYAEIPIDQSVLLDSRSPKSGDKIVLRLVRPGLHMLMDDRGAACKVRVDYPKSGVALRGTAAALGMSEAGGETRFDQDDIELSPLQPLVVTVVDAAHLTTRIVSVTDRHGDILVERNM